MDIDSKLKNFDFSKFILNVASVPANICVNSNCKSKLYVGSISKALRRTALAKKACKVSVRLRLSIYYYFKVFIKPCQRICRSCLQLAERDIRQLKFQHEPLDSNLPTLLFNFINLVTPESIKKKYEKHEKRLQNSISYQKDRINVDHITDEECKTLTGITLDNIVYLSNIVEVHNNNIFIYYCIIRQALSQ
ncbi:unnamed protein product [Didymodactylos carnosus]|uniref:Uncharacterized protein n=1 Tax=Didymodactylos carnosus TaxID=1234261 RepID=A0A8S2XLR4_9BILA|nr:unnamed protein product [Didymodactylos carnosus]